MRLLLASLLFTGCAAMGPTVQSSAQPPIPAMALVGRYGFAHACPVEEYIITAAHVTSGIAEGIPQTYSYVYQQGDRHGFLSPNWEMPFRDMATFSLVHGDVPFWNHLAAETPKVGDSITWYEFDFRSVHSVRRVGKITNVEAGHLAFAPIPSAGASGSCIFNSDNEVVGIVTWSVGPNDDKATSKDWHGYGPLLTGMWRPW